MTPVFSLRTEEVQNLISASERSVHGSVNGAKFQARIAIPHYDRAIADYYGGDLPHGLAAYAAKTKIPFRFRHFGLIVEFEKSIELHLHDGDMILDAGLRNLVAEFGPVVVRNVVLDAAQRDRFHRNMFPHLDFHTDRGENQPNQYSLFTRDPSDPVQASPRESSTVFIANIVGPLQCAREGDPQDSTGVRALYRIFKTEDTESLMGRVIVRQPWNAPPGTGEVTVLDNRTVLHASYHKPGRGYPIGTRYLY